MPRLLRPFLAKGQEGQQGKWQKHQKMNNFVGFEAEERLRNLGQVLEMTEAKVEDRCEIDGKQDAENDCRLG